MLLAGCDYFDSRSAAQLLDAGVSAWQRNDLETAERLLDRGMNRSHGPARDSLLELLVGVQAAQGKLFEVRATYSQLVASDPRSPHARETHDLGILEFRAGNHSAAEKLFAQVERALASATQDDRTRWFRIMNLAHLDLALLAQGKDSFQQHDVVADAIRAQMWPENEEMGQLPPALVDELESYAKVVRREMTAYRHAVDRVEAAVFYARNRGVPDGNGDPACLHFDLRRPAGCVLAIASDETGRSRPL